MRGPLTMLVLAGTLALAAPSGATTILQAGTTDAFAAPSEPASPSAALVSGQGGTFVDFDVFPSGAFVGHTFTGLPDDITGASLEIRLKASSSGTTANDLIRLGFADVSGINKAWASRIGTSVSFGDGLLPDSWDPSDEATILLDLAALPTSSGPQSLIADLNSKGFLDVFVSNDTAVDSLTLTLEMAPLSVPEPAPALLVGLTLTGLAATRLRTRR